MRNRIVWALVLAAASFLILAGCSDDGDDNNLTGNLGGTGGGDIAVTVGAGTNPTYTWPGVGVFTVSVVRADSTGSAAWQIVSSMGDDDIASPVTHGTVPGNALATSTAETTLAAGVQYSVSVARTTATSTSDFGFKVFTP